jgi:2-hydroxychromene-2-carboxylate isomerase
MVAKKAAPRWYFSLRSPYSWFCYRQLLVEAPEVLDQVEWVPVWEPDEYGRKLLAERDVVLPLMPMSRAKNFYILQDTRRLAKERGLDMVWPIDKDPVWEVAHLGYLAAAEEGKGREFLDRCYAARWERGENISDRDVIAAVGREIGLDGDRIGNALDDERLRRAGTDVLVRTEVDGIFGVPLFVVGRQKFWGTDRLERFLEALEAAKPAPAPVVEPEPAWEPDPRELVSAVSDGGHAGGCG